MKHSRPTFVSTYIAEADVNFLLIFGKGKGRSELTFVKKRKEDGKEFPDASDRG